MDEDADMTDDEPVKEDDDDTTEDVAYENSGSEMDFQHNYIQRKAVMGKRTESNCRASAARRQWTSPGPKRLICSSRC